MPKTGDTMHLQMLFTVLFVCSAGMIITFVLGKKARNKYAGFFAR